MNTTLWVEKYRPKHIGDVIFQDERQRNQFQGYIDSGDIPNLFLAGMQGTGKSTISLALTRDLGVDRADVLRINCSDEKIDAMRSKVTNFAMSMPLGRFKVVRLEEIDYLSPDAQALLRSLIEDTAATCRFIATCNYSNRVIPPLKSRFQEIIFKAPNKDQIALRMADLLDKEGVSFDPEELLTYVDVAYPDIRKTIQYLQGNTQNKKLLGPQNTKAETADWKFGLLAAISAGDMKKARKLVCESATREEHEDVYRFMYENLDKFKTSDKDAAVLVIAEFLYKHSLVADTEINLAAMFISLGKLAS